MKLATLLKRPLVLVGLAILLAILATGIWLLAKPPIVLAFGLEKIEIQGLEALAKEETRLHGGIGFVVQVADSYADFSKQIGGFLGPTLVALRPGLAAQSLGSNLAELPESFNRSISRPLVQAGTIDQRLVLLPVAINHLEFTWSAARLADRGLSKIESLADLEGAAGRLAAPGLAPFLVAGGNDHELDLFFSSYLVASYGYPAYQALVDSIKASKDSTSFFLTTVKFRDGQRIETANPFLQAVSSRLFDWRVKNWLHNQWFAMGESDLKSYVEAGLGPMVFQTLTARRAIGSDALLAYRTRPMPTTKGGLPVDLISPLMTLAQPKSGWAGDRAKSFMEFALQEAGQKKLTAATGAAPAASSVQANDLQATDVRNWAAGADHLVQGLAADAFRDPPAAKIWLANLRLWFKSAHASIR